MPKKLKYGIISGTPNYTYTAKFTKGTVLKAQSGRYVVFDTGNVYMRLAANNANAFSGYIEESLTTSASVFESFPIAINPDQFVCELPYADTETAQTSLTAATLLGLFSDLVSIYVDGNSIQYADATTGEQSIRIVGGDITIPTLYATIVSAKMLNTT